jgi:hypothetical protein
VSIGGSAKTVVVRFLGSTGDLIAKEDEAAAKTDLMSKKMGGAISGMSEKSGGALTKLGNKLQSLGVPFAGVLTKAGSQLDATTSKTQKFGTAMAEMGGMVAKAGVVAGVAVAAESLRMGMAYQTSEADIATYAGISQKKADEIGKAFLTTAGKTQYSAQTIADAFARTAGQFSQLNGKALTTSQSMGIMTTATNLAEATQKDLGDSTSALGQVMQQYQIPLKGAGMAANVLYNTSRQLGIGMTQVAKQTSLMGARMGALAPPFQQIGGLLVDLTAHHETGRMAMRALGSTMQKLIEPAANYNNALSKQNTLIQMMPANLRGLAQAYASGKATTAQFSMATQYLTGGQKQLITAFQSQYNATQAAQQQIKETGITAFNAQGKFVGFGSVLGQLNNLLKGHTQAWQLARLQMILGAGASIKMLDVIKAGPEAFKKYVAAADKKNSVEKAARLQEKTLQHQFDQIKSAVRDYGIELGQWLIPKVEKLGKEVVKLIGWFQHHKTVALALAAVIGGVLATAVGFFITSKLIKFGKFMQQGAKDIMGLGKAILSIPGKLATLGAAQETEAAVSEETGAAAQLSFEGIGVAAEESAATVDTAIGSTGIGLVMIGLAIAIGMVAMHWKKCWAEVKTVAKVVWHFLDNDFLRPIERAFDATFSFIEKAGSTAFNALMTPIRVLVNLWKKAWDTMENIVRRVWNFVGGIFKDIGNGVRNLGHIISSPFAALGHLVGLASGGTAMAGQTYMVGEHGPELFTPSANGTIHPNTGIGGGGHSSAGGANITINGFNLANPSQTANEIAWAMKTAPGGAY